MDITARRAFGKTGLSVTSLCIGTSGWGPPREHEGLIDRDSRIGELADAYFAGQLPTNFLDTSNMYGNSESETLIGQALRRAGGLGAGRVLQTKLDRNLDDDSFSTEQMWRSLEQSLERLSVDQVQVLYLHDPQVIGFTASMAPGGPVEALLQMKERGITASIGISGGPVDMLEQFVETDVFDALITHNRYTLVDRSADGLLGAAQRRDMGITNAAPYGGGVLTGDARFRGQYGYRPILPAVQNAVERADRACAEAGVTMAAAALQFSMRDPRIHSTIVGASSRARLNDTYQQATERVPEDLWAELDTLVPPATAVLDAQRRER